MADRKENLPPEVAELFARDGDWLHTEPNHFMFTCPGCEQTARCYKKLTRDEDVWATYCHHEDCDLYGERPVKALDVSSVEARQRRRVGDEQLESASGGGIEDIERFLKLAALRTHPDTPDAALFDSIADLIRKYVYIGRNELIICTLWAAHTWTLQAARHTPYLHLRSALPQSGKSLLLDILYQIVRDGLRITDPTPAAIGKRLRLAELVEREPPVFLWDEVDSAYRRDDSLRETINNGWIRHGPRVIRANEDWPAWGPKAMAGLGNLPHTIYTRVLEIDMTRAMPHEYPVMLTPSEEKKLHFAGEEIRIQLQGFAERNMEALKNAEPALPDKLDQRGMNIATPLLAIADVIGGDWPEKAREAIVTVRSKMLASEFVSDREQLLRDLKRVFGTRKTMTPEEIVSALSKLEETRWTLLSTKGLAATLNEFSEHPGGPRITSKRKRIERKQQRVYLRSQFEDLWRRYLNGDED